MDEFFSGKTVLITGAGGSIGVELAERLSGCCRLGLLDRDESALHAAQLRLYGRANLADDGIILADIRDEQTIFDQIASLRPDVVFHAAALKHVVALEKFPAEAWKTNVLGTLNVLRACVETGVDTFVNVSTDKAAQASSVLGKSKRIAEGLTAWAARQSGRQYLSVRFANVLHTRGSVFDTWNAQICASGPLTLSDDDATRFFITKDQAVEVLLEVARSGAAGEVLVSTDSKELRMLDLARQAIADSGRDIEIIRTGLGAGERMHESLVGVDEVVVPSPGKGYLRLVTEPLAPEDLRVEMLS